MPLDAVVGRILAGLHDAGFTDLVPAHFPVLRYPGPENRRPSELAAEARMTKQAMNYLLGQMQQLGYLTRDIVAEIEAELEHELGPAQFDQLRHLLIQLNATGFVRDSQRPEQRAGRPRQPAG